MRRQQKLVTTTIFTNTALEQPMVGILLAAYNGVKWLPEQIKTIFAQKGVSVKIYVNVDLSTDGSEQWCLKLAESDSRVTVLPTGDRFGFAGRNFFRLIKDADVSDCNYCAFADQDDIWYPDKLIRAINRIEQSSAAGYSSNVMAFWNDGRRKLIDKTMPQTEWDYLFESAGPGCTYVLPAKMWNELKKSVVENYEAVRNIKLHDWFVYAFVRAQNKLWYVDPEPSMLYRQHDSNEFGANSGIKTALKRLQAVRSGWYRHQAAEMCRIFKIDEPVSRCIQNGYAGSIQLLKYLPQLRRRPIDRFFLGCMLLTNSY